jgi:diguanylate cyclase (GGDEF)-like protein
MRPAYRITLIYLVVASLWILGSDWAFAALFPDAFAVISIIKGWGFVAVTAALLLVVLDKTEPAAPAAPAVVQEPGIWDPDTGVLTRGVATFELNRSIAKARRAKCNAFIIVIDLDDFATVEQRLGASAAREVLAELAKRIRGRIRGTDLVGRLASDEFVVVAEDYRDDSTDVVARKLLASISEPVSVDGYSLTVTASIGVAEYPDHGETAEELLDIASKAMRSVKMAGKNGVAVAEQAAPLAF